MPEPVTRHVGSIAVDSRLVFGLVVAMIAGCAGSSTPGASASATVAMSSPSSPAVSGTPAPSRTPTPASSVPSAANVPSSPEPGPSGPSVIDGGPLAAGTYTTTAFQPTLHFRLSDGWTGLFPDDTDEIAFDAADGTGFMAITRVTKVVDRNGVIPVPDDLVAWLAANPAFDWSGTPVPVKIGGVKGAMIDGSVKTGLQSTDVFAYETGNMRVMGGDHIRYYVLPLDGPDLTIVLVGLGGDAGFATTLAAAQATLDSLEIVRP